jgi:RimJ/RimL family protein N-acetyltransferase
MPNIFQGKLVRLRAFEPSDWEFHHEWDRNDTDGGRLTDEIWFPSPREAAQAWAERESKRGAENDVFRFQIERLDGELVGPINTHTVNRRCGTFMYGLAIRPRHRRQGYASEAIALVLRYYFGERRYQKVNAEVYGFNEPSMRLHEKLGFVLEGRLRRIQYSGGQFHDALIYGMTKEEFDARDWGFE